MKPELILDNNLNWIRVDRFISNQRVSQGVARRFVFPTLHEKNPLRTRIGTKSKLSDETLKQGRNRSRCDFDSPSPSNQTIEEINVKFEEAKTKDINIKIGSTIGTSVHFLDITITNENGQLRTSIYHKPTTEPYILPFTSDHPHHVHRNIPYAALLRAARICSHANDFNSERIRIDMSLLLNNYPPHFIA
jgi:hypothetical protein